MAAAPGAAAVGAAADSARPGILPGQRYGLGRGFSFRRESFGGLLYHYEGVQPDPRITFVDNSFLIDLLEAVAAHPHVALDALLDAVRERFALADTERERVDAFIATLIARGALVPQ